MNHRMREFLVLGTLSLASIACSTEDSLDIGSTGSKLSDYADRWEGYSEAYMFSSGDHTSDQLRITLDATGNGTVEVGDQAVYPPPTDPNVGYPGGRAFAGDLVSGLRYPIQNARVEGDRLRFQFSLTDPWQPWCALQTPIPADDGATYHCSRHGYRDAGGCFEVGATPPRPLDCGKLSLCWGTPAICACTASGCAAIQIINLELDASLEDAGTKLVGTLVTHSARVTVRLNRR